jgi:hypothetical protein
MNADINDWTGKTIGEILEQCKCSPGELRYIDEPPGKLCAVEIMCEMNGKREKVVLEITYDVNLFSLDRNWPVDLVKEQKVVKVHRPGEAFF